MRLPIVRATVFLFLLCCAACSYCQASPPGKADPSEQPAIIEELSTSVHFENDGSELRTERQRIKIQNEAGIRLYGIITFDYIAAGSFSIDTVELHKKDGSTVKAGPANIQDVTPEISRVAPMYSDLHQKQVTVPGLSVGDELIFQYTARAPILVPNQFWFQHSFNKDEVVLLESVRIDVPSERKLHLKFLPEYKPEIATTGNRTVYEWHNANQKPLEKKKTTGLRKKAVEGDAQPPSIDLSTFENWEQVGLLVLQPGARTLSRHRGHQGQGRRVDPGLGYSGSQG